MHSLVTTDWLADQLGQPHLAILDASYHVPANRDARAEFAAAHIPGARFLDLASLADEESPMVHALPTASQLAQRLAGLGVSEGDRIVIYDDSDAKTSARAWFILRLHGARHVAILDGGLRKWRAEGRTLERGEIAATPTTFAASSGPSAVRTKADMLANLESGAEQVLDARGAGRFSGTEPEIRPGMPSGHIPGSRNLPYGELLNPDGTFKSSGDLRLAFEKAGIDLDRPVTTTCGSGVTASVLLFAMHLLGKDEDVALYDGSWSEWAVDPDTPKETGEAA